LGENAEFLLQQDNVKPHHDWASLRYAHQYCNLLSINTPPNTTHVLQPVDDTIGQRFRADAVEIINEAIESKALNTKWLASEKRALFVDSITRTAIAWKSDPAKRNLIKASCDRCGLTIEVGGQIPASRTRYNMDPSQIAFSLNKHVRPVRFPVDYGRSLVDSSHSSFLDYKQFEPFAPKGTRPYVHTDGVGVPEPEPLLLPMAVEELGEAELGADLWSDIDSGSEEPEFGPTYYSDSENEECIEIGSQDKMDEEVQRLERGKRRSCLPGCECENAERAHRCLCVKKNGACSTQCPCVCSTRKTEVVAQVPSNMFIDVDDAIAENEGEVVVEAIRSHELEDEALYFVVIFDDGEEQECGLEDLMDKDGTVNTKLLAYCAAANLDLAPYAAQMQQILSGKETFTDLNN
jgi:hypothetical protein